MNRQTFDRGLLPEPTIYLAARGLMAQPARGRWASIKCPSHKNGGESHASLRVSLDDGHFRCMVCGVKGRDILALHRLITGVGFVEAARALGAMR